jgi:hypothetical protein
MTISTLVKLGIGLFVILYVKSTLFRKSSNVEKQIEQLINEWFNVNIKVRIDGIGNTNGNAKLLGGEYRYLTKTVILNTRCVRSRNIESLAKTIAHEGRHAWQHANGYKFSPSSVPYKERPEEIDAFAYGNEYGKAMLDEIRSRGLEAALLAEMKKRR